MQFSSFSAPRVLSSPIGYRRQETSRLKAMPLTFMILIFVCFFSFLPIRMDGLSSFFHEAFPHRRHHHLFSSSSRSSLFIAFASAQTPLAWSQETYTQGLIKYDEIKPSPDGAVKVMRFIIRIDPANPDGPPTQVRLGNVLNTILIFETPKDEIYYPNHDYATYGDTNIVNTTGAMPMPGKLDFLITGVMIDSIIIIRRLAPGPTSKNADGTARYNFVVRAGLIVQRSSYFDTNILGENVPNDASGVAGYCEPSISVIRFEATVAEQYRIELVDLGLLNYEHNYTKAIGETLSRTQYWWSEEAKFPATYGVIDKSGATRNSAWPIDLLSQPPVGMPRQMNVVYFCSPLEVRGEIILHNLHVNVSTSSTSHVRNVGVIGFAAPTARTTTFPSIGEGGRLRLNAMFANLRIGCQIQSNFDPHAPDVCESPLTLFANDGDGTIPPEKLTRAALIYVAYLPAAKHPFPSAYASLDTAILDDPPPEARVFKVKPGGKLEIVDMSSVLKPRGTVFSGMHSIESRGSSSSTLVTGLDLSTPFAWLDNVTVLPPLTALDGAVIDVSRFILDDGFPGRVIAASSTFDEASGASILVCDTWLANRTRIRFPTSVIVEEGAKVSECPLTMTVVPEDDETTTAEDETTTTEDETTTAEDETTTTEDETTTADDETTTAEDETTTTEDGTTTTEDETTTAEDETTTTEDETTTTTEEDEITTTTQEDETTTTDEAIATSENDETPTMVDTLTTAEESESLSDDEETSPLNTIDVDVETSTTVDDVDTTADVSSPSSAETDDEGTSAALLETTSEEDATIPETATATGAEAEDDASTTTEEGATSSSTGDGEEETTPTTLIFIEEEDTTTAEEDTATEASTSPLVLLPPSSEGDGSAGDDLGKYENKTDHSDGTNVGIYVIAGGALPLGAVGGGADALMSLQLLAMFVLVACSIPGVNKGGMDTLLTPLRLSSLDRYEGIVGQVVILCGCYLLYGLVMLIVFVFIAKEEVEKKATLVDATNSMRFAKDDVVQIGGNSMSVVEVTKSRFQRTKEILKHPQAIPYVHQIVFSGFVYESCFLLYGNARPDPATGERVVGAIGLVLSIASVCAYYWIAIRAARADERTAEEVRIELESIRQLGNDAFAADKEGENDDDNDGYEKGAAPPTVTAATVAGNNTNHHRANAINGSAARYAIINGQKPSGAVLAAATAGKRAVDINAFAINDSVMLPATENTNTTNDGSGGDNTTKTKTRRAIVAAAGVNAFWASRAEPYHKSLTDGIMQPFRFLLVPVEHWRKDVLLSDRCVFATSLKPKRYPLTVAHHLVRGTVITIICSVPVATDKECIVVMTLAALACLAHAAFIAYTRCYRVPVNNFLQGSQSFVLGCVALVRAGTVSNYYNDSTVDLIVTIFTIVIVILTGFNVAASLGSSFIEMCIISPKLQRFLREEEMSMVNQAEDLMMASQLVMAKQSTTHNSNINGDGDAVDKKGEAAVVVVKDDADKMYSDEEGDAGGYNNDAKNTKYHHNHNNNNNNNSKVNDAAAPSSFDMAAVIIAPASPELATFDTVMATSFTPQQQHHNVVAAAAALPPSPSLANSPPPQGSRKRMSVLVGGVSDGENQCEGGGRSVNKNNNNSFGLNASLNNNNNDNSNNMHANDPNLIASVHRTPMANSAGVVGGGGMTPTSRQLQLQIAEANDFR